MKKNCSCLISFVYITKNRIWNQIWNAWIRMCFAQKWSKYHDFKSGRNFALSESWEISKTSKQLSLLVRSKERPQSIPIHSSEFLWRFMRSYVIKKAYIFGFLATLVTCNIVFISIILSFIHCFFREIGNFFLNTRWLGGLRIYKMIVLN